jgi:hypothetical protein
MIFTLLRGQCYFSAALGFGEAKVLCTTVW